MTRDPHATSRVDFAHFFDYLVLARRRLLDWIGAQPGDLYTRAYPFGLGSIRATLVHIADITPPRRTRTTAGGLAVRLLFHEVHHRAQVMVMLRLADVPAQDLDYSRLMWERTSVTESE